MAAFGLLMLGAFMGWLVSYGIYRVTDWNNPGTVFSSVIAATFSGGIFVFIQWLLQSGGVPYIQHSIGEATGKTLPSGIAVFFYPVGLAYGALCNGLGHYIANGNNNRYREYSALSLGIASVLLLLLLFWLYKWLPPP